MLPKSHLYQNKGIMSDPKAVLEREEICRLLRGLHRPVSWEDYNAITFGWQRGTSYKWNTKAEFFTGSGEIEAFGELFFDNLATMLGVTGSAVGHIGYGLTGQSWQGGRMGTRWPLQLHGKRSTMSGTFRRAGYVCCSGIFTTRG